MYPYSYISLKLGILTIFFSTTKIKIETSKSHQFLQISKINISFYNILKQYNQIKNIRPLTHTQLLKYDFVKIFKF